MMRAVRFPKDLEDATEINRLIVGARAILEFTRFNKRIAIPDAKEFKKHLTFWKDELTKTEDYIYQLRLFAPQIQQRGFSVNGGGRSHYLSAASEAENLIDPLIKRADSIRRMIAHIRGYENERQILWVAPLRIHDEHP